MIVNEEDPVKAQLVDDRITTLLAQANLAIARRIATKAANYLNLLIDGGNFAVLGQTIEILGLRATAQILDALRPGAAARAAARLARPGDPLRRPRPATTSTSPGR